MEYSFSRRRSSCGKVSLSSLKTSLLNLRRSSRESLAPPESIESQPSEVMEM